MKNFFIVFATICSVFLFNSCKDKIDLVGGAKESAIVVGILDQASTTHYVKITRTFIGDGQTSAIDIAQISDSSYFNQIDVKIQEVLGNGSLGRLFTLYDTIVQNKEINGVFYAPQQKVYVFHTNPSQPLLDDATYKLTASIDNGRIVVTGQTDLVSGITSGTWAGVNSNLKFTASGTTLGQYASQNINVTNVGSAYKLNAKARFDYREFTTGLTDSTDHSVWYDIGEVDVTPGFNSSQNFNFSGEIFYRRLKEAIPVSASVEKRVHTGIEIQLTGASRELANYINVNKPSSTLAQNKPKYTNLTITEGHNVIGIFAARQTVRVYKPAVGTSHIVQSIDKKSRRELCIGPLTGPLGFCSRHVSDLSPTMETWYCN